MSSMGKTSLKFNFSVVKEIEGGTVDQMLASIENKIQEILKTVPGSTYEGMSLDRNVNNTSK